MVKEGAVDLSCKLNYLRVSLLGVFLYGDCVQLKFSL